MRPTRERHGLCSRAARASGASELADAKPPDSVRTACGREPRSAPPDAAAARSAQTGQRRPPWLGSRPGEYGWALAGLSWRAHAAPRHLRLSRQRTGPAAGCDAFGGHPDEGCALAAPMARRGLAGLALFPGAEEHCMPSRSRPPGPPAAPALPLPRRALPGNDPNAALLRRPQAEATRGHMCRAVRRGLLRCPLAQPLATRSPHAAAHHSLFAGAASRAPTARRTRLLLLPGAFLGGGGLICSWAASPIADARQSLADCYSRGARCGSSHVPRAWRCGRRSPAPRRQAPPRLGCIRPTSDHSALHLRDLRAA